MIYTIINYKYFKYKIGAEFHFNPVIGNELFKSIE